MTDTAAPAATSEAAPATLAGAAVAPEPAPAAQPAPSAADTLHPAPSPAEVDPSTPPAAAEAEPPAVAEPVALTPESYSTLKFREGMSPTESRLKSFTELAAKANLSPEDAQTLVDLQQDIATEQGEAFRTAQEADFKKVQAEWTAESLKLPWLAADPDLKTNKGMTSIANLFDEFDKTGAFRSMLDTTGMGNHPAALQFLYDAAQLLTEGTPISTARPIASGPNGRARGTSPAEILHPEA